MSILSKNASLKLVECISNNHAEVVLPLLQGTFVLFQVNLNHNAGWAVLNKTAYVKAMPCLSDSNPFFFGQIIQDSIWMKIGLWTMRIVSHWYIWFTIISIWEAQSNGVTDKFNKENRFWIPLGILAKKLHNNLKLCNFGFRLYYGQNICIQSNLVKKLRVAEIFRSFKDQMAKSQDNKSIRPRQGGSKHNF